MAELMASVRTKFPPGRSWLLGRGRAVLAVRPANRPVRIVDGDVRVKTVGPPLVRRSGELIPVQIPEIPDVIALALAQLVRDRWAAEKRGHDDGRGRLRVMVMGSSE